MIVGAIILIAITLSNAPLGQILAGMRQTDGGMTLARRSNTSAAETQCAAPPCRQARRREYWPAAGAGRGGRVLRVSLAAVLVQGYLRFRRLPVARTRPADAGHADADHLGRHQSRGHLHGQSLRAHAGLGAARPMADQTPASMPSCSAPCWPSASAPQRAW